MTNILGNNLLPGNSTFLLFSGPFYIRLIDIFVLIIGSYCAGIDTSFYPHPYDCHYFTNCPADGAGDFHFTICDNPDFCPNTAGKICDVDSCATLCNRGNSLFEHYRIDLEKKYYVIIILQLLLHANEWMDKAKMHVILLVILLTVTHL